MTHFRIWTPALSPPRTIDHVMLGILLATAVAVWLVVRHVWPIPFWNSQDDYRYLSLSHALNLEYYLAHRQWFLDGGLVGHPGIPYYFVSWLCLRAAALFAGRTDVIAFALGQADSFLVATQVAALVLATLGVWLTWHVLEPLSAVSKCVAILSFFAVDFYSLQFGLITLGNETFALPTTALLFWSLRELANAKTFEVKPWIILGITAGFGYTIKLLYLDILAAGLAVAVVDGFWKRGPSKFLILAWICRLAILLALFAGTAYLLLFVALGSQGVSYLLEFHFKILSYQGLYGSGESGVASLKSLIDNLATWASRSALPYVLAICLLILLWRLWRLHRSGTLDYALVVWSVGAMTALLFATASVLKHFAPHYSVAIAAILPFVIWGILRSGGAASATQSTPSRWASLAYPAAARLTITLLLALAGIHTARVTAAGLSSQHQTARDILDDKAAIVGMPLEPGEARLWTYRVPVQEFALPFVLGYSGVLPLMAKAESAGGPDSSSVQRRDRNYRYVILDRSYFRDAAAVRSAKGSLEPTQSYIIHARSDDIIHELKQVLVVERRRD